MLKPSLKLVSQTSQGIRTVKKPKVLKIKGKYNITMLDGSKENWYIILVKYVNGKPVLRVRHQEGFLSYIVVSNILSFDFWK